MAAIGAAQLLLAHRLLQPTGLLDGQPAGGVPRAESNLSPELHVRAVDRARPSSFLSSALSLQPSPLDGWPPL
eukprot:241937-Prymnesium_polylepis.1